MRKILLRKKYNTSNRKSLYLGVIFLFSLLVGKILVSNLLATSGIELRKLETRIGELEDVNQKLTQVITDKTSLGYLQSKAEELNLFEQQQMVRIENSASLAYRD